MNRLYKYSAIFALLSSFLSASNVFAISLTGTALTTGNYTLYRNTVTSTGALWLKLSTQANGSGIALTPMAIADPFVAGGFTFAISVSGTIAYETTDTRVIKIKNDFVNNAGTLFYTTSGVAGIHDITFDNSGSLVYNNPIGGSDDFWYKYITDTVTTNKGYFSVANVDQGVLFPNIATFSYTNSPPPPPTNTCSNGGFFGQINCLTGSGIAGVTTIQNGKIGQVITGVFSVLLLCLACFMIAMVYTRLKRKK